MCSDEKFFRGNSTAHDTSREGRECPEGSESEKEGMMEESEDGMSK
jgi:hypothetical protein